MTEQRRARWQRRALIALMLALAALWITGPLIATGGWYRSHDGMRYPYLLYRFKQAFDAGILYPRWLPQMMGGYGYPTFVFYQPGYFYFALPLAYAMQVVTAAKAACFAMLFLGGAGAYRLARHYNPPALSAVFAVAFLLSPYIGINLFLRGDHSELLAMLLLPWCVHFALRVCDKIEAGRALRRTAAGFVAALAAVVVSHPFVAFFFIPFITLAFVARAASAGWNREILLAGALLLGLAAVLCAPYWLPLFAMMHHVRFQGAVSGFYSPLMHLRSLEDFFFHPRHAPYVQWALALAGFMLAWKQGAFLRLCAYYSLFLLFLTTEYSRFVWELGYGALKYVQFPWRQQSVNATLQFIGMVQLGAVAAALGRRRAEAAYAAAAILLLVVLAASYRSFRLQLPLYALAMQVDEKAAQAWPKRLRGVKLRATEYYAEMSARERQSFMSLASTGEFYPRHARAQGLVNRLARPVPTVEPVVKEEDISLRTGPQDGPYFIDASATLRAPGAVRLNQFYLPGWELRVDGHAVPWRPAAGEAAGEAVAAGVDGNGRMRVHFFAPGTYHIQAWYDGPPGWRWRNAAVALGAMLLCVALIRRKRVLIYLARGKKSAKPQAII